MTELTYERRKELLNLAEMVDRLDKPDRAVDWQIHLRDGMEGVGMYADHPRYTASVDVALTLVTDGKEWLVRSDEQAGAMANIIDHDGEPEFCPAYAATPALALCAAALRAMASE